MNRRILYFIFYSLTILYMFVGCQEPTNLVSPKVLVCGDHHILIVDLQESTPDSPAVIWSWDAHEAMELPDDFRLTKFNSMDDCKMTTDGSKMLVSSSSGGVAIIRLDDQKVLFNAEVPNAHSIEILPGNRIAAAASTHPGGNKLLVFDINSGDILFEDSLYSAHGLVWDDQRNGLFALGYDVLRFYTDGVNGQMNLEGEWAIPGISGHDLTMNADGDHLLLTEHTGAWKFDIDKKSFTKIDRFPDAENIKSLGINQSGQFIYTVPEESWWTFHVSFFNPNLKLAFPDIKVYKARWYEP